MTPRARWGIDWLDYNGYTVVTKATKEFIDASGRRKVKGNMDIELAVDAMELAEQIDQMVLFAGDGDFRSLVAAVQRRGVRVTVVSTIQPASDDRRRVAAPSRRFHGPQGDFRKRGSEINNSTKACLQSGIPRSVKN